MIKKIKLFVNNNEQSLRNSIVIRDKFLSAGFKVTDNDEYNLGVAVGGDGSFLRMIKQNNFDSKIYYVGINSGHLGFLQEVTMEDLDKFIMELKYDRYKVEEVGIQQTTVNMGDKDLLFKSLNEIIVRDIMCKCVDLNIKINGDLLEVFKGDGIMISTTCGSTAHNLGYGGSIVFSTLPTLQITPMAPINSKSYSSIVNSIVLPEGNIISISPVSDKKTYDIVVDGEDNICENVNSIHTEIGKDKIKCLRFSHYNFAQKLNDKLLSN